MDSDEKKFLQSVREDIKDTSGQNNQEKLVYFIVGLSVATVIVAIVSFALLLSKNSQVTSLEAQIKEEVTVPLQGLAKEKEQVTAISSQLEVLSTALAGRIKYPQIIKDLALNTYKQTRWDSVDYEGGEVVISGKASDFMGASKVVSAYENYRSASGVNLTSINIDTQAGQVGYSIEMKVDEKGYKFISKQIAPANQTSEEQNAGR